MFEKIKEYLLYLAALASIGGLVLLFNDGFEQQAQAVVMHPKTGPQFAKTSAMILAPSKKSGGSGVILSSSHKGSIILTNKHVCEVITTGGSIKTIDTEVTVRLYKIYDKHDLCMIKVNEDLGVNTQIAKQSPKLYTESITSGHPQLLPPISSHGHFSNYEEIEIAVGLKPCDGTEVDEEMMMCIFMGGKPIIKKFDSQVISSLIMPGSSGSAVFDSEGDISGLVFAGSSGLSYGFIVPHKYVVDFVENNNRYNWKKVDPRSKMQSAAASITKVRDYCKTNYIQKCKTVKFNSLWSEE